MVSSRWIGRYVAVGIILILTLIIAVKYVGKDNDVAPVVRKYPGDGSFRYNIQMPKDMPLNYEPRNSADTVTLTSCPLNIPRNNDPTFKYVSEVVSMLNDVSVLRDIKWFALDEVARRTLLTGALYLNNQHATGSEKPVNTFTIYVASTDRNNIYSLWRDLAKMTSTMTSLFTCPKNSPDGISDGCSVLKSKDKKFECNVIGPLLMDKNKNEVIVDNKEMHIKHVYAYSRMFPLAHSAYYGLKIPIPQDPVYALSHVVPFQGTDASREQRYQYGQECGGLSPDVVPLMTPHVKEYDKALTNQTLKALHQCSQVLTNNGFANFHNECRQPQETFKPFNVLLDHFKSKHESTLYFEDDRRVIILHKGKGTYNLREPHAQYWSQYGQDKYLDKLMNGKKGGFFLEIGGYDGEDMSNTLFFEKSRGWSGLLVEAVPREFNSIVHKDRNSYALHACVSPTARHNTFDVGPGLSGANEIMPKEQKKRIQETLKSQTVWQVKVACKSLEDTLAILNVTHIDYFSLDVEGAEVYILNNLDWNKLDIDIFTIETFFDRDEIINIMKSRGYERIDKVAYDDVFRKIRT